MSGDFSQVEVAPARNLTQVATDLVTRMYDLESAIETQEEALATLRAEYDKLTQVEIPDVLGTIESLKLGDGSVLKVKEDLKASVSLENRTAAWGWLRAQGHGAVIREALTIDTRGLTPKQIEDLTKAFEKTRVEPESSQTVHPQTLKALCKELLEKGTKLPPSFTIFQFKKATVTKGKK